MKIRPVGDELLHADRRTDGRSNKQTNMTKLKAAFRNFANAALNDLMDTRPGLKMQFENHNFAQHPYRLCHVY